MDIYYNFINIFYSLIFLSSSLLDTRWGVENITQNKTNLAFLPMEITFFTWLIGIIKSQQEKYKRSEK